MKLGILGVVEYKSDAKFIKLNLILKYEYGIRNQHLRQSPKRCNYYMEIRKMRVPND